MHGAHGRLSWADGRVYVGALANDKRHGVGEYVWKDGRKYRGEWNDGK